MPTQTNTAAPGAATPVTAPPLGDLIGAGVVLLVAIFFAYALLRARRRRRAEIAGETDEALPEEAQAEAGTEAQEALPPGVPPVRPPPPEGEGGAPEAGKARRREAFLEAQRRIREEKAEEAAVREAEAQRQAEAKAAAQAEAEAEAKARAQREAEEAERRRQALLAPSGSLTQSLSRTRGGFVARLSGVLGKKLDEAALEELEEVLFTADIGVHTAARLLDTVRASAKSAELQDPAKLQAAVRQEIASILALDGADGARGLDPGKAPERPYVLMVVGVNGVGKTTTIGKLAGRLTAQGLKVVLAAGDTFRAAAVEQLEVWADRVGAEVVKGAGGADPSSVIFDAIQHAKAEGADVVIADTAGRLHTKVPLMEELKKVHRVMGKARAGAPDDVLLVVDATTGQNAVQQAKLFREVVPLTGLALTKLDGTAKGGVIIGICDELKLPVRYIGVGEKVGDLRPFEPKAFVEALFE
jgi:fused signal recognition particle receptor